MSYFTNFDVIGKNDKVSDIRRATSCFGTLYDDKIAVSKEIIVYVPALGDYNGKLKHYSFVLSAKEEIEKYINILREAGFNVSFNNELVEENISIYNYSSGKNSSEPISFYKVKVDINEVFHNKSKLLLPLTYVRYLYEDYHPGEFRKIVANIFNLYDNIKEVNVNKLLMIAEQSNLKIRQGAVGHASCCMMSSNDLYKPVILEERLINYTGVNNSAQAGGKLEFEKPVGYINTAKMIQDLIDNKQYNQLIKIFKLK